MRAKLLVEQIRMELTEQFNTGIRNSTGAISNVLKLETLLDQSINSK